MNEQRQSLRQEQAAGDAAVDGLLAGLVAGIAGAVYLIVAGLISGFSLAAIMGNFDPSSGGNAVTGTLVHLAVSGVYGVLFAILYRWISRFWSWTRMMTWLLGLVYGLILFLIAEITFRAGIDTPFADVATVNTVLFHLIYGLVLGLVLGRK